MPEQSEEERRRTMAESRSQTLGFTSFQMTRPSFPPGMRGKILQIIQHPVFDPMMGVLIVFNVILMVVDADMQTTCPGATSSTAASQSDDVPASCEHAFSKTANNALLAIYTAELVLRLFAYGRSFFQSPWNLLDFSIVTLGLSDLIVSDLLPLPNLQMLRLFRLARLTRIIRLLKQFPTLFVLVQGFAGAMEAMAWGFLLILILLMIWALVAVELVHEVNLSVDHGDNAWCEEAFESVVRAVIYFFQTLVAGDSWGACAIPIIKSSPVSFLVFAGALVSVQLGFTNLILAIIVDKAVVARDSDNGDVIRRKKNQKKQFAEELRHVLETADKDGNGNLTFDEVVETYEANESVRQHFDLMDVDRRDLKQLFRLMGSEEMGAVSYNEFISTFQKAQLQDMRVYLMVMHLQVKQVAHMMRQMKSSLWGDCDFAYQDLHRVTSKSTEKKGGPSVLFKARDKEEQPEWTSPRSSASGAGARASEQDAPRCRLGESPRVAKAPPPPQWEPTFWQLPPQAPADEPGQELSFSAELEQLGASLESRLRALADDTMERIATLARQAGSSGNLPAGAAVPAAADGASLHDSGAPRPCGQVGAGGGGGGALLPEGCGLLAKGPGLGVDDAGSALLNGRGHCGTELDGPPTDGKDLW